MAGASFFLAIAFSPFLKIDGWNDSITDYKTPLALPGYWVLTVVWQQRSGRVLLKRRNSRI
jgi:hypothetical protein